MIPMLDAFLIAAESALADEREAMASFETTTPEHTYHKGRAEGIAWSIYWFGLSNASEGNGEHEDGNRIYDLASRDNRNNEPGSPAEIQANHVNGY